MMLNKILELDKKGYAIDIFNADVEMLSVALVKDGLGIRRHVDFQGLSTLEDKKIRMNAHLNDMEAELERKLNDAN